MIFQILTKVREKGSSLFGKIGKIISSKKCDEELEKDIESHLLEADLGPTVTKELLSEINASENREAIVQNIKIKLLEMLKSTEIDFSQSHIINNKLNVILMYGVNGGGKTTTSGKIAHMLKAQGNNVLIAACDTYRAAAVNQLQEISEKICDIVKPTKQNSDPASVAYDAVIQASKNKKDALIIDTAGRLHINNNLMDELEKIQRVIKKANSEVNIIGILVLDGSNGQNIINQYNLFSSKIKIDGIVITKIDSSSKGGAVVNISKSSKDLKIFFLCNGEKIDNIYKFSAESFVNSFFE